ncbi:CD44 antigen [Heteronotia binoei]|uniref:CD44 antigen n=1 Tax=Heteronotia binoei TaxID=13085 RepID=UPI002931794E|nr:CD44 antigen [Heteronotia binoei]
MAKFWLCAAVGLYLLQLCLAQISLNISCRYAGVFHVEKNRRYSLTREEAIELCKALNSTLPTWEQMERAFNLGLETCRYGFIEEKIVVPRHTPYHLCAANTTGIYILQSNISDRYDTYCFNSSETNDRDCDPVTQLYSSWPDDQSSIEIFNADGTHYTDGKLNTESPPVNDDDNSMGSGSANDRGTTDPSVISFDEDTTRITYVVRTTDKSLNPDDPEDHNVKHNNEDQQPPNTDKDETSEESEEEEESSGHLKPSGFLEWNSSHDKEHHLSNPTMSVMVAVSQLFVSINPIIVTTAVVSSSDVKREESARDSLIHVVHSGWNNEVRYSANDTRDDTLPGTVSPGDGEHYSTAMSSRDSFLKQKVSTLHLQDGVHSGLEAEAGLPTNTTSDDLHLRLVPSDEKQNNLEEAFHAAVFINGSAKDEESHQDQLLSVGKPGGRRGGSSSTNRTSHGVVQILIPPSESDRENKSARTDSNQDQLPSGSDGRSNQNEHQESSDTADEVSNDLMKHGGSTQNPLTHGMYPDSELENEEQYSTNTYSEETLPGIIPPSDNEQKNTSIYTVVVSTDGASHEDSDHDHFDWDSENTYPKNVSRDGMPPVISPSESKNEKNLKTNHTAVLSSGDTYSEDSAHDIILHRKHSDWDSEDKYPTSRDHLLPESIPSVESEHENEPTHTVVISSDGTEHEVSIQDSPNHETDPGWDSAEKHPANESTDGVVPRIILPAEHVHEKEILHTVAIHNNDAHEDATQEPLPPVHQPDWHTEEDYFTTTSVHQPDWHMEEEYSANTSRDDILMGNSANNGIEHDPLHTDVVSHDGTKDEDSTPGPVKHDSEDKYSTNSTKGVLPPGIVPRTGTNRKNNTYHTGLAPDLPEDRGSQQGDSTPKTQTRVAHIPDWLIVVASLLALALILGVCIAVNSRRRCGQKQKLVINNGKGVVDNKNMGGLNGEASKSHEMVHLVHKEQPEDQTESHDEFLQIDETNNLQEVDLKSGV